MYHIYENNFKGFTCTHIGYWDLIGNKFNGHDLHLHLNKENIRAYHLVCKKHSHDPTTFTLDCTNSTTFFHSLIRNKYFLEADVIHMHLMHNTNFDFLHLPFISAYKPTVMTLHDPWTLGGHCVHHNDCRKWVTHCGDCPDLSLMFVRDTDTSALEFAIKKFSIQNANIHAIVASKWMEEKVRQSPIWRGKKITRIPFGIEQSIFKPSEQIQIRKELGIDDDSIVLFARTERYFKGLKIIQSALQGLSSYKIFLLTVGEKGLLENLPTNIRHEDFGWLTDDLKLAKLYQAADMFLMPSECETFGMMAIEAMSCGKMVLALNGTALPSVINSPECGIAVDKENFASELRRLCSNLDEVRERGQKSLKFALSAYNKKKYLKQIIRVYKDAMTDFIMPDNGRFLLEQLHKFPPLEKSSIDSTSGQSAENIQNRLARLKRFYYKHGLLKTAIKTVEKVVEKF